MKKVYCLIVLAALFAFSSCSFFQDDKSSKGKEKIRTIVELPDSVKQKIVEQDALMTELVNKVDTLTEELNLAKAENAELKEKVAELKSPKSTWAYMTLAAIVLSILAVIITFLRSKGVSKEQVGEQIKQALDVSSRINKLQDDVEQLLLQRNRTTHQSSNYAPQHTETRIRKIENTLEQVVKVVNSLSQQTPQVNSRTNDSSKRPKDTEYQKIGYAKVDTDIYFTTIYESNQEGCVFKLTFTSQSKGKFNIIALDKIQSSNDWQRKVECSGVSIKEAKDFRLEDEGVCEKIEENTWKVTKPLKIRLIK